MTDDSEHDMAWVVARLMEPCIKPILAADCAPFPCCLSRTNLGVAVSKVELCLGQETFIKECG